MLKIHYDPSLVAAINDAQVLDWCADVWELARITDSNITVSQEIVVLGFRVLIKRKVIPHDQIELTWVDAQGRNHTTHFNQDGRTENLPHSYMEDFLVELIVS